MWQLLHYVAVLTYGSRVLVHLCHRCCVLYTTDAVFCATEHTICGRRGNVQLSQQGRRGSSA
jgi:hypothetical protein